MSLLANLLSSSHNYQYNWPQGNDSLIVIPLIHMQHGGVCCHFGRFVDKRALQILSEKSDLP